MQKLVNNPSLGWVSTRHLQHLVARAESVGVAMDEFLAEGGLNKTQLADSNGLIPIAAIEAMLAAYTRKYTDPLLGLSLASDIQPATFGVLGYISQACTTLADVLDVVTRYNGLLSNIGKTSVAHEPGAVQVNWACLTGSDVLKRQITEYVIGSFSVLLRTLLPEQADLLKAIHFEHSRPANSDTARKYFAFFKCPVYFDKPTSCIVTPSSMLKTKLHHSDSFLKDLLDQHAQNLLKQREQVFSLPDEVKQLVSAMIIDGVPTKDTVAMQLGLSGRSLHRKLEELGTGYREILDEVRLEIALSKLKEDAESGSKIAEYLGFSSHQAFWRWYKQMTGKTPAEHRKEMTGKHS
ncbi:AraC family transcriptional regulator [Stenotrophobium rhamnosiphilum]|uniref:HTH araC/xylS-type domain-containing protein n=1 Tax=Stenotrophobium rhamnosiphilum TaxID=2029166 RepID=A0A2T5MB58_9GAMM|nr:AraC family transcriptional regulator [Stenotrophobium rhamnosiphilum]PTU28249.1 hypothetical protein CJD38_17600 [Stenotrophobium rhamnosiphilum]